MRYLIDDYQHQLGEHCASTVMRNLIGHYAGLFLSESMVFGLGSGLDLLVIEAPRLKPPVMVFGRSLTFEIDLAHALGLDYEELVDGDDEQAWRTVRDEVSRGRPTAVSGDVFHLDHMKAQGVHFPGHRFVIVGFDDDEQVAFLVDRKDEEPISCAFESLQLSRNPRDFISTYNQWGRFGPSQKPRALAEAIDIALSTSARRWTSDDGVPPAVQMVAQQVGATVTSGTAALASLSTFVRSLHAHEDGDFLSKYLAYSIEHYGTGGGNFRSMYARFLEEAAEIISLPDEVPALARGAATSWSALAQGLYPPNERVDENLAVLVDDVVTAEKKLMTSLADYQASRKTAAG